MAGLHTQASLRNRSRRFSKRAGILPVPLLWQMASFGVTFNPHCEIKKMTTQLDLSELKRVWIEESVLRLDRWHGMSFSADELHNFLQAPPHKNCSLCNTQKGNKT
jgi:hypothetical protein